MSSFAARLLGRAAFGAGAGGSVVGLLATDSIGEMIRNNAAKIREAIMPAMAATAATAASGAGDALVLSRSDLAQIIVQTRPSRIGSLLLLAGVSLGGGAIWFLGWQRVGWVTLQQLQASLSAVKTSIFAAVTQKTNELLGRLARVEGEVGDTKECTLQTRDAVQKLEDELVQVRDTVGAIDARMGSLEANTERSKVGIELLCDLIATSGLLQNASTSALGRLRDFTSGDSQLSAAGSRSVAVAERRSAGELPPVPRPMRELPGPPGVGTLEQAAPSFVRGMLGSPPQAPPPQLSL